MIRRRIVITVVLLGSVMFGQGELGTIAGKITDPDGEAIGGATVQVTNTSSGAVFKTESSRAGTFTISQLPVGNYELLVPSIGFTFFPYVKKNLLIEAGKALRVDIQLEWPINLGTLGDDTFLTLRNRYAGVTGPAPRTPDGKPDFSGIWNGNGDPTPEEAPVLAWADAIRKQRFENQFRDVPSAACLPGETFPTSPLPYKLVQTPSLLLQIVEDVPGFRQVFLDGRSHPKDLDPTWKGHSIGTWDGDTLVIDTIGFNDKSWLPQGLPHTEMLHVVERYRRPDLAHLVIDVAVEDPGTLRKPWNLHMTWELAPGEELIEYICNENNLDRPNPSVK